MDSTWGEEPIVWDELDMFLDVPPEATIVPASVPTAPSDEEKTNKRRAAVAAASRATRAKRKRELEDLRLKNIQLEKERDKFLSTIADLQMKVQSLRETGSVDLRMENDLLRAELKEHKNFIANFKRIADGMPASNSAKKVMIKQGSDTAISQVLGLLATSMVDPSWKRGHVHEHPELLLMYQCLPHGVPHELTKRMSVRVDVPVVPFCDIETMAYIFWRGWCDKDTNHRLSKHFGCVANDIKEIDTGFQHGTEIKMESVVANGFPDTAKVFYYREDQVDSTTKQKSKVDTVLLLSAKNKKVAKSSYPVSELFHKHPPSKASVRDLFEAEDVKNRLDFICVQQNYDAVVLASTNTQYSMELVPVEEGVNRVRSNILEGITVRKVPGGAALTYVVSYPTAPENLHMKTSREVMINEEGRLNAQWTNVIKEVYQIVTEELGEEVYEGFRELHRLNYPVPKEILTTIFPIT